MRIRSLVVLMLLANTVGRPVDARAQKGMAVQLGVRISPDTVTIGERFIVVVRIRAPRGSVIEFPQTIDSATAANPLATEMIGTPAVQPVEDTMGVTASAAYRLAAWDVGPQPLGLGPVAVRLNGETGYVSLADRSVFVRSVLPEDSALQVPKPPRPAIELVPFNWMPLLIAALVLAAAALAWRLWIWYRRRSSRPLDPFSAAEREFARVEAMALINAGKPEMHAALMSDVMRQYLAARVPGVARSQTSSELLAAASDIHQAAHGLGDILWRADLVKFGRHPIDAGDGERLGASARTIVRDVEAYFVEREKREQEKKAA